MISLRLRLRNAGTRPSPRLRQNSQLAATSSLKARGAPIDIHPEVQEALAHKRPVVSLETALVTHGLPYPHSLEVPIALEEAVRAHGAIPATIGIVDGRIKVGLERHELERLASPSKKAAKVSRRDIAAAIATKSDGGTTCSATLVFSAMAGINVFATGGLGGVHRGAENSLDISADLLELSRCPVGLVSSGCKSILDIKRTLEYLETAGVPVVAYGKTKEFPAFFTRDSGYNVPWNTSDPAIAAQMIYTQWQLGMKNGMVFAAPIPEEYQAAGRKIQEFVDQAVRESEENGVAASGNDATPWLLGRVLELSQGKSLESNIALLKSNAGIGGQIAVQYAKLAGWDGKGQGAFTPSDLFRPRTVPFSKDTYTGPQAQTHTDPVKIAIVGAAALDVTARADDSVNPKLAPHSTVPGMVSLTLGGVGRNVAEASTRAASTAYPGVGSLLIAPVGKDLFGHILTEEITKSGMRNDGLVVTANRTAVCNMVLDSNGGLVGGVADMVVNQALPAELVIIILAPHSPEYIAFDGNLDQHTIKTLVDYSQKGHAKLLFEPTSVVKSTRILPSIVAWLKTTQQPTQPLITHFTPNLLELSQVYEEARSEDYDLMSDNYWWDTVNKLSLGSNFRNEVDLLARKNAHDEDESKGTLGFLTEQGIAQMAVNLLPFFQHIWIKCGPYGAIAVMHILAKDAPQSGFARERTNFAQRSIVAHGLNGDILVLKHFPSYHVDSLVNVTGAGDTFVGAMLAGIAHDGKAIYDPKGLDSVVNTAQRAACLTLQSHEAVSPLVTKLARV